MTDYPSFPDKGDKSIVYVRDVKATDLPQEIRNQIGGLAKVYAVHAESGEVLALVGDRDQAFVMARRNEFSPVSVH